MEEKLAFKISGNRPIIDAAHERLLPAIGIFQRFDVDLLHLKHRFHDSFRFLRVLVIQHINQNGGSDLPRQTEFVLEPTAR